jgi:D-arginine dehydrogenase
MTETADVLIVGAGIAGASVAAQLAGHCRVVVVEAETAPGYHSTGRSAAFFAETYGGPGVQPLSSASAGFLNAPPAGFADAPLVRPRGALHIADAANRSRLASFAADFADSGVAVMPLDQAAARARAPLLADAWSAHALWEPDCLDIDVAALHAGFLRRARQSGAVIHTDARLDALARVGGRWRCNAGSRAIHADIVVNAAGAWADDVARLAGVLPVGVRPYRRTMVVADIDCPVDATWPLVISAAGDLYFKPDAGTMWISPHDESPDVAGDVQPEEYDIALAIDTFCRVTTASVRRVVRAWAGLRSFAPDRLPVYGFDPVGAGFFWCAGQGGFGIQTAPAAAELCACLLVGAGTTPAGVDPGRYTPARFAR